MTPVKPSPARYLVRPVSYLVAAGILLCAVGEQVECTTSWRNFCTYMKPDEPTQQRAPMLPPRIAISTLTSTASDSYTVFNTW
jgi:hypothetical protein